MIDASIFLSYGVAGSIIITIVSLLYCFNRRKICKKELVLQAEEIIPETFTSPEPPVKLIFEVNNNDNEQWPIIN